MFFCFVFVMPLCASVYLCLVVIFLFIFLPYFSCKASDSSAFSVIGYIIYVSNYYFCFFNIGRIPKSAIRDAISNALVALCCCMNGVWVNRF